MKWATLRVSAGKRANSRASASSSGNSGGTPSRVLSNGQGFSPYMRRANRLQVSVGTIGEREVAVAVRTQRVAYAQTKQRPQLGSGVLKRLLVEGWQVVPGVLVVKPFPQRETDHGRQLARTAVGSAPERVQPDDQRARIAMPAVEQIQHSQLLVRGCGHHGQGYEGPAEVLTEVAWGGAAWTWSFRSPRCRTGRDVRA